MDTLVPMKIALTIAGSDSGGGAGIQADLKTFQQFGVFGTSVIVALTAQNTRGVRAVETVSESMVAAQLAALAEDLPPAALKTGMLADVALARLVGKAIRENGWSPLVVDPVMVSTSGHRLLTPEAEDVVRESLLPLAALVTPNLDEAGDPHRPRGSRRGLHGARRRDPAQLRRRRGAGEGGSPRGRRDHRPAGHAGGHPRLPPPRIETTSTHGTGCTLSAAITAGLALGRDLETRLPTPSTTSTAPSPPRRGSAAGTGRWTTRSATVIPSTLSSRA